MLILRGNPNSFMSENCDRSLSSFEAIEEMYRMAVRRLIGGGAWLSTGRNTRLRLPYVQTVIGGSYTSAATESFSNQSANRGQIPFPSVDTSNVGASTTLSSSTSSTAGGTRRNESKRPRAEYQDEQARVLQASLSHVIVLGWTEEAMISGARDIGMSPAIVGSLRRKEAALVEFFMDDCLQRLIDRIDAGDDIQSLTPSQCISKLVRLRLEMQAPYISKWPQALSIQAQPSNITTSFKQRAMLVDEIWHAVGDDGSDMDWYAKRTILGGIYSTTEIYMLTDISPDFRDTWAFLDDRVHDAFELKKSIQEAKYLAEAVGAGIGNSLQGFVKGVFT